MNVDGCGGKIIKVHKLVFDEHTVNVIGWDFLVYE